MAKAKDTGYIYVINKKPYDVYESSDHKLYYNNGSKNVTITPDLLISQGGAGRLMANPDKEQNMSTQAAQSTYNAGISFNNVNNLLQGLTNPITGTSVALGSLNNAYKWLTGDPNTTGIWEGTTNPLVQVPAAVGTAGKALDEVNKILGNADAQTYLNSSNSSSNSSSNNSVTGNTSSIIGDALNEAFGYNKPNYLNSTGSVGVASANAPRLMSAAELANLYGINYDYDYILGVLNDASDAYYNEVSEKAKKLQEDTLRNQVNLYYQYLDSMRQQRANAVNTGINRGTQAAQEVAQYLAHQQQITNALSESNSGLYDLYNQAATKRMENRVSALDKYNSLGTALMSAGANFNANDVQRYAADMSAASQATYAKAYQNAAALNAQAAVDSAYMNSYLNPANSALLKTYLLSNQNASNLNNAQINYYNAQANALKNNK